MAGIKRSSKIINKLVGEVDRRLSLDPNGSVTAICNEIGLRKETYYYRKRVEQEEKSVMSADGIVKTGFSVKKRSTEELMEEFLILETRMADIKKELSKRMSE